MEDQYMKNMELVVELARRFLDAQDRIEEITETSNHWYNQYRELKLKYEPNTEDF